MVVGSGGGGGSSADGSLAGRTVKFRLSSVDALPDLFGLDNLLLYSLFRGEF